MSSSSGQPDSSVASRLFHPLSAGLMLTSAGSLSAEIIYNDTPITGSQFFSITAPTNDFELRLNAGDEANTSFVQLKPQSGVALTSEVMSGDVISSESSFSNTLFVDVPSGQHHYGFSLTDGSTVYGWISVTHDQGFGTGTGTVNAWAYENTGESIQVGQIPEPATTASVTAAAALLAGSAAVWKRRRQKLAAIAA